MMDLFQNLWAMGGAPTGAPTDMSQIKVQQQPVDLAGTIGAANDQLSFSNAQTSAEGNDMLKHGLLMAARSIGAGRGKQEQPLIQAPQYRGGRAPDAFLAEQISGMNMAGMNRAPGLLAK